MKHPDLNLLVALDALLDERSVAAAARRLQLSGPAMSRTLMRIREAVGDPILVRAGRKLVPTPRALDLQELVHKTANTALGLLQPGSVQRIHDLQREFILRVNDTFVAAFGGRLFNAVLERAPKTTLRFTAETEIDDDALRQGRIDLWIGASNALDPEVRVSTLFRTRFVAVARDGHPIFEREITAGRFAAYPHINVSRRGVRSGPIDIELAAQDLQRNVTLITPTFSMGLLALGNSDLLMPIPEHVLWSLDRLGTRLRAFAIPLKLEDFAIRQAWHPRLHNDAVHRWLRSVITEICKEKTSAGKPAGPPGRRP